MKVKINLVLLTTEAFLSANQTLVYAIGFI